MLVFFYLLEIFVFFSYVQRGLGAGVLPMTWLQNNAFVF